MNDLTNQIVCSPIIFTPAKVKSISRTAPVVHIGDRRSDELDRSVHSPFVGKVVRNHSKPSSLHRL